MQLKKGQKSKKITEKKNVFNNNLCNKKKYVTGIKLSKKCKFLIMLY